MNQTAQLINELKNAGEDFEWYPTTDEIIRKVARDVPSCLDWHRRRGHGGKVKLLDIGAGDGRVLTDIAAASDGDHGFELFAIEKSMTHIANMPKKIVVIGTDLNENTLVESRSTRSFATRPTRNSSTG